MKINHENGLSLVNIHSEINLKPEDVFDVFARHFSGS